MTETHASELEHAIRTSADQLLNLVEAARISGYSRNYLGRMVRAGRITNHGRKGAPRILRSELPMKVGCVPLSGGPRRADPGIQDLTGYALATRGQG